MRWLAFAVLVVAANAAADAPNRLGYQGRLLDASGAPVAGTVSITYAIFAASSGGTALWSESQTLGLTDGFYATFLGDGTALPPGLFDGSERYLEMSIGGGGTLTPRQRITAVPYALGATNATRATTAASADALSGTLSGDVTGGQGTTAIAALQGNAVSAAHPADGQILKFDAKSGTWAPAADAVNAGTVTSVSASSPLTITNATSAPAISLGVVGAANGGTGLAASSGTALLRGDGSGGWATGALATADLPALGGDVTGAGGANALTALQGKPLSMTGLASGDVLAYGSGGWAPTPGGVSVVAGAGLSGGGVVALGQSVTLANAGLVSLAGGGGVTATTTGGAVKLDTRAGGDLSGSLNLATVAGVQGVPVSATAPLDGQVLKYDVGSGQWRAGVDANSGGTVTRVSASSPLTITNATSTPSLALGVVPPANGGTGLTASSGTKFLRGDGLGGWATGALAAGDLPSGSGAYVQTSPGSVQVVQPTSDVRGLVVRPVAGGSADPFDVQDAGGGALAGVSATGTLSAKAFAGNGASLTSLTGANVVGAVGSAGSAGSFTGSLAGDVTGAQGATTVAKLAGTPLASTSPAKGQALLFDGTSWTPGAPGVNVAAGAGLASATSSNTVTLSVASGGVANSMLANSQLTISTAGPLSGGGAVALGGSLSLSLGTVGVGSGGTGLTAGPTAAGQVLRATGAGAWSAAALQASDLPGLSSQYVDLASAQTVGGAKSFTSTVTAAALSFGSGNFTVTPAPLGILDFAAPTGQVANLKVEADTSNAQLRLFKTGSESAVQFVVANEFGASYTSTAVLHLHDNAVTGTGLVVDRNNNVGVGTTTPAAGFEVVPNAQFDGSVSAYSFSGGGASLTNLNPANLSAAVPVTKGGTGATTATAAFAALSPLASKGDLLGFSGVQNVRVPAGASGLWLTTDSTQTAGLAWTAPSPVTVSAGLGLTGGGAVSLGGATSLAIDTTGASTGNVLTKTSGGLGWTNGSTLTALNASALTTGTLPDGRLSGTYSSNITFAGNVAFANSPQVPRGALPATVGAAGAVWFGTDNNLYVSDGTVWRQIGTGAPITGGTPGTDCATLKAQGQPSGAYTLNPSGGSTSAFTGYCDNATAGGGWMMLLNLKSNDSTLHGYNDTTFWLGTGTEGGPSSPYTAGFKSAATVNTGSYNQLMIYMHNAGTPIGYAIYDVLPQYQNTPWYALIGGVSNAVITGARNQQSGNSNAGSPCCSQDRFGDPFIDAQNGEPIMLNQTSTSNGYWGVDTVTNVRIATMAGSGDWSYPHTFAGLGGHHERPAGSWLTDFESAPILSYCQPGNAYGGTTNMNGNITTGSCPGTPSYLPRDIAVLVRLQSTAGAALGALANPGLSCSDLYSKGVVQSGAYWVQPGGVGNAIQVYCNMVDAGGGWTLLVNLKSSTQTTHYWNDTTFWTSPSTEGSVARPFNQGYKGDAFSKVAFKELMVYMHNAGTLVAYGTYDVLASYQTQSLQQLLGSVSNTVITNPRKGQYGNSGAIGNCCGETRWGDPFVDAQNPDAVILNQQYNSSGPWGVDTVTYNRISTIAGNGNYSYPHTLSGLGGHHERPAGSWVTNYQSSPIMSYCQPGTGYGPGASANIVGNLATAGNCPGTPSYLPRDHAIYVR